MNVHNGHTLSKFFITRNHDGSEAGAVSARESRQENRYHLSNNHVFFDLMVPLPLLKVAQWPLCLIVNIHECQFGNFT